MTLEEAKEALEELKQEGNSEEDILKILYVMFRDDAIELSDLRTFVDLLGYEFTDEFEAMSLEDKKTKGLAWNDKEVVSNNNENESIESGKVTPYKNDSWASIWDFANGIEWTTADVDMQRSGASDTFNRYAIAYKQANTLFFGDDKEAFAKCLQEVKKLREQFSMFDWKRLINGTRDSRARYEYRRMMNAKFPTEQS